MHSMITTRLAQTDKDILVKVCYSFRPEFQFGRV